MEPLWAFAGLKPASIAFAASFQKRKLSFGCGNGCHCEGVQERFPVINLPRERAVLSWGQSLEVATRRRAGDSRAAAGVGASLTTPAAAPPPAPPLPPGGPAQPSAPPEGGSAINKRSSVTRGPRSSCAPPPIAGSGRPG